VNRSRAGRLLVGALLLASTAAASRPAGASAASAARSTAKPDGRIVIVSIPRLGWDDVVPADMPALTDLADQGAAGALSVRSIGRHTGPAEGYATLGAGNRMQAPDDDRMDAYARLGRLPHGGTALRLMHAIGRSPKGAFVVPGIAAVDDANAHTHQGASSGALGDVIAKAGWKTDVLFDPDGWADGPGPGGLALVDHQGSLDRAGVLGTTYVGPGAAGVNVNQLARGVRELPKRDTVALVEIGDVARADALHGNRADRQAAARRADRALAAVIDHLDLSKDRVVVLAPAAPSPQAQPVPIVMAGPGVERGLVRSATTRRTGYATLTDVAPTIASWLGQKVPDSMAGTPITVTADGRSGIDKLDSLRTAVAETRFVDRSAGKLSSTLPIVFGAWSVLLLAAAFVPLPSRLRRALVTFLCWLAVGMVAVPGTAFALAALSTRGWGQPAWFAVLFGGALAIGTLATWLARPFPQPWVAPTFVTGVTWLLLVADGLTGSRLQFDAALGNSPTVAGRFSGFGNLGFAVLAATTILLACAAAARRTTPDGKAGFRGWGVAAALFAVAIVVDGAPTFGADVGGALTLVPVAFLTVWALAGRRINTALLGVAAAAGVVLVGAFGLWDRSRPGDERTHLGRFLAGDHQARETVIRKAVSAGVSVYHSSLVWILVATVGLAAIAWWQRRDALETVFREGSVARIGLVSATGCGILGSALNDSGVAVAAMMAFVLVPVVVLVLRAAHADGPHSRSPERAADSADGATGTGDAVLAVDAS
jgi:hypothetical protein